MVKQYPHTATIGNDTFECRWEYRVNNTIYDFNDQEVLIKGICFTKWPATGLNKAVAIQIRDENNQLVISGIVRKISRGQLNTRLWL